MSRTRSAVNGARYTADFSAPPSEVLPAQAGDRGILRRRVKITVEIFRRWFRIFLRGDVAQMGERCVRNAQVEGSNPFISTTSL